MIAPSYQFVDPATGATTPNAHRFLWGLFSSIYAMQQAVRLTSFTVATLPTAPAIGTRAFVTDATAPSFLGALTGGGTVHCPVFYNGTAWVAG